MRWYFGYSCMIILQKNKICGTQPGTQPPVLIFLFVLKYDVRRQLCFLFQRYWQYFWPVMQLYIPIISLDTHLGFNDHSTQTLKENGPWIGIFVFPYSFQKWPARHVFSYSVFFILRIAVSFDRICCTLSGTSTFVGLIQTIFALKRSVVSAVGSSWNKLTLAFVLDLCVLWWVQCCVGHVGYLLGYVHHNTTNRRERVELAGK